MDLVFRKAQYIKLEFALPLDTKDDVEKKELVTQKKEARCHIVLARLFTNFLLF
jgi:hypothetical protein